MSRPLAGRVSVLTPAGRGAVAVVAASGPAAIKAVEGAFTASNGRPLAQQSQDRILFGHWSAGNRREEVLVIRGVGDSLEIHCHGGAAASERIVSALVAAGCLVEAWPNWLKRQADCPIVAEADGALAQVTTRRTAAILLAQRNSALAQAVTDVQRALDHNSSESARRMLSALVERSAVGLHLTQPWQVAIAGRPNVGKSSLINALVGFQRAIVFDQPGTTRDVLSADTAVDGWPVRLTDAAGIRSADDPLEAEGVARAREQFARADLVLWVLDATTIAKPTEALEVAEYEIQQETDPVARLTQPLVVLNKVDLLPSVPLENHTSVVPISALTRAGIDELLRAISRRLVPSPPQTGEAVPFTSRHAELLQLALGAVEKDDFANARQLLTTLTGMR
jgi:tRNA modification GTPase